MFSSAGLVHYFQSHYKCDSRGIKVTWLRTSVFSCFKYVSRLGKRSCLEVSTTTLLTFYNCNHTHGNPERLLENHWTQETSVYVELLSNDKINCTYLNEIRLDIHQFRECRY